MSLSIALAFATGFTSECGAQDAQTFILATREAVDVGVDSLTGAASWREVWVRNRSTIPISVDSVFIEQCLNTETPCGKYKTKVKVQPGERRTVLRMKPKNRGERVWFGHYVVQWSVDPAAASKMAAEMQFALRQAGLLAPLQQVDPAQRDREVLERVQPTQTIEQQLAQITARRRAEAIARGDTLPPVRVERDTEPSISPEEMAQLGDKILTWRAEPDTLILKMGDKLLLEKLRIVAIAADGKSFGRIRGSYKFGFADNIITIAPPDTLIPVTRGRSTFLVAPGDALNKGRTKPLPQLKFTIIVP